MSQAIETEGPYFHLRVTRVIRETPDACSLVLEIPEHLRETFAYRAGQFLTFRFAVAGKRLVRCYSLASASGTESEHKVTIKRVRDGRVSNFVNDEVAEADLLEVMKPAGHFCLQERSTPLVMFSGGSGITPCISLVKSALATTGRRIHLLYANRDEDSIIFREELAALGAAHPDRFELRHSLDVHEGFVDVARARAFAEAHPDADFYICGPGPFMDVVEEALRSLGVDDERLFIERFEISEVPVDAPGAAPAEGGPVVTVLLDGKRTELVLRPGETVLEGARRGGLEPPFACEEAYCGCCMAMVKEGEVAMKMNDGGIDQAQIDKGWVLTCQGVPKTDKVTIEYPD